MSPIAPFVQGIEDQFQGVHLLELLTRMLAALLIGAVLSVRPWRLLLRQPLPRSEMIQAQLLLCSASSVIIAVIGDSVAKAFSLVCLGGFVRFKAGLKDPRDAALMYVVIGLGMACGYGHLGLASVGTAFVGSLLIGIDTFARPDRAHLRRIKVSATAEDPASAEAALRNALRAQNVLIRSSALDFDSRRLELDLEEREPGQVASALKAAQAPPLRDLKWTDVPG